MRGRMICCIMLEVTGVYCTMHVTRVRGGRVL